jgi:predicted ATPase
MLPKPNTLLRYNTHMDGVRFIESLKLTNLLSFGPEGMEIELQPLNVLIGPNGSGKSNFIEAIRLVRSLATDLTTPFVRSNSSPQDWRWKGDNLKRSDVKFIGNIKIKSKIYTDIRKIKYMILRHHINILLNDNIKIYNEQLLLSNDDINYEDISHDGEIYKESILLSDKRAIVTSLCSYIKNIKIYSDAEMGVLSKVRQAQSVATSPEFLFEDFSNLAVVLGTIKTNIPLRNALIEKLKLFYEPVIGYDVVPFGGQVQIYFEERGLSQTVPATRLSDGTLRFLCLLVILLHPTPPPLICLEEPELGMHPDVLPVIAELLIDASKRTQIILTTHSPALVSAIGDQHPEAIVVCEKSDEGTTMRRLDPEKMKVWLDKYSLGELWTSGEIGGNRW